MAPRDDGVVMAKDDQEGESFLGRWSRRKSDARAMEDLPGDLPLETAERHEDLPEETEPEPTIDPASLPDIDKMEAGSDFSPFMQAGVPPELKTKALRKLWRVKPELANLDGLIDYGEDLTGSFQVVDKLQTAYQVGKGFLKDEPSAEPEAEITEEIPAEPVETAAREEDTAAPINPKDETSALSDPSAEKEAPRQGPAKG